jgi:hypothetical protein
MSFSTKIEYIFLIFCIKFICCTTCEFFPGYKINLLFYKVQISINVQKIILKIFLLSVALPWNGGSGWLNELGSWIT